MTTGQLIKKTRKNAGMTQAELAGKLGIPYQSVSQWERDTRNPKYDTIKRIAAALGVEWTELVPTEEQGAVIAAHIIEGADLTVKDKAGNVIRQGSGKPWRKLSDAEAHRMGFLQFNSDEDRIAFFYSHLNTDGKLAASKCFYQHLDKDSIKDVADYVEKLSEIPQYQRPAAPQSPPAPAEEQSTIRPTGAPEKPEEGEHG